MPYTIPTIPRYYPPFPPLPTPPAPGAVSTGTFSGTYGTYTSSSSNGVGPGCPDWGNNSFISTLTSSVTGPLDGTANVATMATYAVPVDPNFTNYATKQAVALAVGAPLQTDVTTILNSPANTQLKGALTAKPVAGNCYNFMIGELGGHYNISGVRTETVNAQLAITVKVPSGQTVGDLYFGIYNITSTGGFQSLTLTVTKNTSDIVFNKTYYSFASFQSDSQIQAFKFPTGSLVAGTALPVKITVSEVLGQGQGAYFRILLADPPAPEAASSNNAPKDKNGAAQGALNSTGVNADNLLAPSGKRMLIESDVVPALAISGCVILVGIMMTSGLWRVRKPRDL